MDRREFIKRVLRGERSERIPRALYGAGLWSYRHSALNIAELHKCPERFGKALADFFSELDTDIIFLGSGLNTFPAEAIGGDLAFTGEKAPLLSFPLIQKTQDARYLEDIDISVSANALALIEMIAVIRELLPDRFICATSWGPFTWGMILCEWNLLRDKTATDIEFVGEVCELGVRLSQAFFSPLIERGLIDGIALPDGAVTLIPGSVYHDIVLPAERRLFEWAGERRVGSFLHQCGNISTQLALYPESGADCISVDTGVSIGEVCRLYGERLVTAGNVDVINTIFGGDPAVLCKAVSECVAEVPDPFRNYILMPSCDLPPDTPVHHAKEFLACADLVEQTIRAGK
ncbi:MAG: hypothetical protein HQL08_04465 [Nitrospirae bacterium]|nr:hypothetical protein [Nitrospirota bacterium]